METIFGYMQDLYKSFNHAYCTADALKLIIFEHLNNIWVATSNATQFDSREEDGKDEMGLNGATENPLAIGVHSPCSHSRAQCRQFFLLSLQHVHEGPPPFVQIRTRSLSRLVDLSTLVCSLTWRCRRPSGHEAEGTGE